MSQHGSRCQYGGVPRFLRYLLIWISCTAVSVTAVVLTVRFVVGSTRPTPPVARSAPTVFATPSPDGGEREHTKKPSPPPRTSSAAPRPSATRSASPSPSPSPTRSATGAPDGGSTQGPGCADGAGVHTIQSNGGQASVRFGSSEVCLVSAVPTRGFTVRTSQNDPGTLTVTFSGDRQESVITARASPQSGATVQETSW